MLLCMEFISLDFPGQLINDIHYMFDNDIHDLHNSWIADAPNLADVVPSMVPFPI